MDFQKKQFVIKNKSYFDKMCQKFSITPKVMELLFARGYTTEESISKFLSPGISQIYNPYLLSGMQDAVDIIKKHIEQGHSITILGDYDTDGICATAILEKYLLSLNVKVTHFLPNRIIDGYGMTMDTIDKIWTQFRPDLIITVDCGISCYQEIEYAKSLGIEVVVTDHHELPDVLPNCTIVDPKIPSKYPFNGLCGAGVVLKLVQAMAGIKTALEYTNICALATVADIVPLIDENRAIVVDGLSKQQELPKGVLALIKKLKLKQLTSTDISMKLAPKLNTAGRMGDPSIAYQLFEENNDKVIQNTIKQLFELNDKRVQDGNMIYDECLEILKKENIAQLGAIVLCGNNWNSGVLGIICSRLVELYQKPVFLMTQVGTELKGSVRSIENVDVSKLMNELKNHFIRFGGHSQAGGYSIKPEEFDILKQLINEKILHQPKQTQSNVVYYDQVLSLKEINQQLMTQLELLQPYGFGNEKPMFKINVDSVPFASLKNFPAHIKGHHAGIDFICYQGEKYLPQLTSNCEKNILGDLAINSFGSKNTIQVMIKNIQFGQNRTDIAHDLIFAKYIEQLKYLSTKQSFEPQYNTLDEIIQQYNNMPNNGILILSFQLENYQYFCKTITQPIEYAYSKPLSSIGSNTIVFQPAEELDLHNYHTIIMLDKPIIAQYLTKFEGKTVIVNQEECTMPIFDHLSTDRNIFAYTHQAIQSLSTNGKTYNDLREYFKEVKKLLPQYKNYRYHQFYFIISVFEELGFVKIDNNQISILQSEKKALNTSAIYQFVHHILHSS